jgi:hypothetical protein
MPATPAESTPKVLPKDVIERIEFLLRLSRRTDSYVLKQAAEEIRRLRTLELELKAEVRKLTENNHRLKQKLEQVAARRTEARK